MISPRSLQAWRSLGSWWEAGEHHNPVRERGMVSSRAVSAVPSAPCARADTQHWWWLLPSHSLDWGGHCLGVWDTLQETGEEYLGTFKIYYGRFRGGKERDKGRLGRRKKCLGKWSQDQADGHWLFWPSSVPVQLILSYLLINSISNYLPLWRACLLCACVLRGLHESSWSWAMVKWTT